MEEDRGSPALVLSPSFREAAAEDAGDRLTSTVDSPQKISAIPEHQYEVEEDDDDDTSEDFEFAFVIKDPESIPAITADEIFSNGQIRSVYPVFNRDLLLADGGGDGGDAVEEKAVRMPLRRLLIEERNASSASASSSSEMGELEGIDPGTYCVWRPGSVPPSPARCKKSCSTGSSFRWRIRDLVRRSRSDGKEKFVFLAAEEKKPSRSSEKKKSEGEAAAKGEGETEWWVVDGEMHEIGEHVPHRERFVIPRDNLPNKRRKQLREQFMRRTRIILKDSEHESWCKRYMELYQELRENWERLYWDEGYSKKIAQDHANYDSAEDDDSDFSPFRRRQSHAEANKDQVFGGNKQGNTWERITQIRDKFEYDRERRMREKAFAPMNMANGFGSQDPDSRNQPFDAKKFFPQS